MLKKHILLRAYGSHLMGMGHLYRMRLIIQEIEKEPSIKISLLTRAHPESVALYKSLNLNHLYEMRPETSEEEEIDFIRENLPSAFNCIINDQLMSSLPLATALTEISSSILSLDDTGSGAVLFQRLINVLYRNQPPLDQENNHYKYMILPDLQAAKSQYELREEVTKIFINQGAADTWGAIPDIMDDLNAIGAPITLRILLGPAFIHFKELGRALEKTRHKVEVYNSTDSVIALAEDCDIAILGAGNTLFEVASIGVPVIGCTREEKELLTINNLLESKIIVGKLALYNDYSVSHLVTSLMADFESRKGLSMSGRDNFSYSGLESMFKIVKEML